MPAAPRSTAHALKVEDLLERVQRGVVRVPRFQRALRWGTKENRLLLDSVYRGFPVGSLLFWVRPAPAERLEFGGLPIDADKGEAWYVVDGQQRLNALVEALLTPGQPGRAFHLDLESGEISTEPGEHRSIPVHALGDGVRLLKWMDAHSLPARLKEAAFQASKDLREYQVPAYVLQTDDEGVVRTVFDRLNSQGKRLTKEEIFQALDVGSYEEGTTLAGLADRLLELRFGPVPLPVLQQTLAAVSGADLTVGFRPRWAPAERKQVYGRAESALRAAIHLLRVEAGFVHARLLPHALTLTLLAAYLERFPNPPPRVRTLLVSWVWRVSLSGQAKGDFPDTRRFLAAIRVASEVDAARDLLATAERPTAPPRLSGSFNLRTARSRLEAIVLLRPLLLAQPKLVEAIADGASKGLRMFRPYRADLSVPGARSLANLVAVIPGRPPSSPELDYIELGDAALDDRSAIAVRSRRLESAWNALVRDRAGLDDSDRPTIASLVVPDEDSDE